MNDELVLDHVDEDEVTRLGAVGQIRPTIPNFGLIYSGTAVGVRRTCKINRTIRDGDQATTTIAIVGKGVFGMRPASRDNLLVDDVLTALRLFKTGMIQVAGTASWVDAFFLSGGTAFQSHSQRPFKPGLRLPAAEISGLIETWRLLEGKGWHFDFSLNRFNIAFDRKRLEDRVVDLVIAAEALLLSDMNDKYRGELRFRFALRASKFIQSDIYHEREIFR